MNLARRNVSSNPHATMFASLTWLVTTAAEAHRLVKAGGLYLNNKPVAYADYTLNQSDLIDGRVAILRAGRAKHLILMLS
jgi:tyrosyl-tRNA synthetase